MCFETFFRIVSTLSKNDEARDLFAIGMAILHFADTASCGMIGFAHSIRGEVELVKDLVQMNDQGSPIILFGEDGRYKSYTHSIT